MSLPLDVMSAPTPSTGSARWLVAISIAAIAPSTLGCPGDLDPEVSRHKISGAAGNTGAGVGGAGGAGGTGGSAGFCDAPAMLFMPKCVFPGACHDSTSAGNGGLDMNTAGLVGRLLGKTSTGVNLSDCGGETKAYLVAETDPAQGLLLDKLFADPLPCGNRMPVGPALLPNEEACVRDWTRGVTTGAIAP